MRLKSYLRFDRLFSLLYWLSLALTIAHVIDDAIVGEAGWWGVSVGEFIVFNAQLYLVLPPFGWALARRGRAAGFVIVLFYALQAFYGGGLNHVRHLMDDFGGSRLLPTLLQTAGIQIGEVRGRGWLTGVFWFFGLGTTPPHSHSLLSNLIIFVAIGVNFGLILMCIRGIWLVWRKRGQAVASSLRIDRLPGS